MIIMKWYDYNFVSIPNSGYYTLCVNIKNFKSIISRKPFLKFVYVYYEFDEIFENIGIEDEYEVIAWCERKFKNEDKAKDSFENSKILKSIYGKNEPNNRTYPQFYTEKRYLNKKERQYKKSCLNKELNNDTNEFDSLCKNDHKHYEKKFSWFDYRRKGFKNKETRHRVERKKLNKGKYSIRYDSEFMNIEYCIETNSI